MFIDTKISQMNKSLRYIFNFGSILVGSKPSEPILEHINPQRIITSNENIDPQIVLKIINKMRIGNILRNQYIFLIANGALFIDHLDATPTGLVCRFHDP